MLTQLFLTQTIEKTLNAYLRIKQAYPLPSQLIGKTIGVKLKGLGLTFYMNFAENYLYISQGCIGPPDLLIAAPPFTLLNMATGSDISQSLNEPELELTGDATLALTFKQCLDQLEIDWEHYLSLVLGASVSRKIMSTFYQCKTKTEHKRQSCQTNLRDYIQYEANLTPTPQTLETFYQQIDELKMEADLCESRIQHLQKRLKQKRF